MSKKKKLNLSKKQPEFSQKDSPFSPVTVLSQPEITSDIPSTEAAEFSKAVNQSRENIHAADQETKGKRGRKALPRDAAGNIIRDPQAPMQQVGNAAPLVLNQQSIEENKMILRPLISVASEFTVKIAGNPEAAASAAESETLINVGAILIEKYMPNVMNRYGMETVFCFTLFTWTMRVQKLRVETIKKNIEVEKRKSELKNGELPSEEISSGLRTK